MKIFENFLNIELDFYGATNNKFKVGIDEDTIIFEVLEDEDDGYRSCLDTVVVSDQTNADKDFLGKHFAKVCIETIEYNYFKGYAIKDAASDHNWLEFGTDHADDYYPYFVFRYNPVKVEVAEVAEVENIIREKHRIEDRIKELMDTNHQMVRDAMVRVSKERNK